MRLIVPFTPGGRPRISSPVSWPSACPPRLGQPVVVENMPGASGNIGSLQVARAKPDGLHDHVVGQHAGDECQPVPQIPTLRPSGRFRAAGHERLGHAGAGRPSFRKSPATLAGDDRARQGSICKSQTYASPGVGTPHHLAMALLRDCVGHRDGARPLQGLGWARCRISCRARSATCFCPCMCAASYIQAGKLKAIAIGSPERRPQLPDVPTLGESGLKGCRRRHVVRLFRAQRHAHRCRCTIQPRDHRHPGVCPKPRTAFEKQGLAPATSTPAALGEIAARDRVRWADIVAKRGIQPE